MDCFLVATALVMLHIKAGFYGMIKFLTNYTTPLQVFDSDISGFWNSSFLYRISVGACHSFILHIYLKNLELLYYFSLSLSLSSSPPTSNQSSSVIAHHFCAPIIEPNTLLSIFELRRNQGRTYQGSSGHIAP